MADNKGYISYVTEKGSIHISEEAVAGIAGSAALEVDGVAGLRSGYSKDTERSGSKALTKGVKVRTDNETLAIDLYLLARPDLPLANLGTEVQQAVKSAVEAATAVQVQCVNVAICGVRSVRKA